MTSQTQSEQIEGVSLFSKEIHPFKQAATALIVMLLALFVTKAIQEESTDTVVFWEVVLSVLMGYALFNSIFLYT